MPVNFIGYLFRWTQSCRTFIWIT